LCPSCAHSVPVWCPVSFRRSRLRPLGRFGQCHCNGGCLVKADPSHSGGQDCDLMFVGGSTPMRQPTQRRASFSSKSNCWSRNGEAMKPKRV